MYLSIIGRGDKARVYLVESFRKDGKVSTRNIKSFGSVKDINKDDPHALDKLKAQYSKENFRAQRKAREEQNLKEVLQQDFAKITAKAPLVDYSPLLLQPIWDNLGLSKTIFSLQQYHCNGITYDLNKVISTLCFLKITDPGSIRKAYSRRADLIGAPLWGVSLDQMYASLDFLYEHKETLLRRINHTLDKQFNRTYSMVFYDVTNAYIESALTDEECMKLRTSMRDEVIELLDSSCKKGIITEELKSTIINEKTYDLNELPPDLKQELKCLFYLRMRGLSKEHRYDLPIISISMVIDDNAIPIDYEIYSGCASEYKTMRQSIEKMKKKYGIKNTIVVADRGLNSAENIDMLLEMKYGFLVAQKVSNLGKKVTEQMLDPTGYETTVILKDPSKGADNKDNIKDIIKTKIIDFVKDDKKGHSVNCKLIFTHSQNREQWDLKQIDMAVREAQKAIAANKELPLSKRGWVSFIKKEKNIQKATEINQKLVDNKRQLAGYSGVIYHEPPEKDNFSISPREIVHSYHHLVQIEECFRIMKTNLGLRPMYVQIEEHIEGHVLLCVMALTIIRLLQIKLEQKGTPLTIEEIVSALNNARLVLLYLSEDKQLFLSTSSYRHIYKNSERMSEEKMKEVIQESCSEDNTDKIALAQELMPLNYIGDKSMIEKCLRMRFGADQPLVDPIIFELISGNLKKDSTL